MRRIQYFITLATEDDRMRVDFETDQGEVTALHIDVYTAQGSMKYRVAIADLSQALTFAIDDLKSQWHLYKQRFLRDHR